MRQQGTNKNNIQKKNTIITHPTKHHIKTPHQSTVPKQTPDRNTILKHHAKAP